MEQNISLVQARALEQVELDSAADDDYSDMQDIDDVSFINYKINCSILCLVNKNSYQPFRIIFLISCNIFKLQNMNSPREHKVNIEDIEFQMDPDSSNFKTETNHILEDGNLAKSYNYNHTRFWNLFELIFFNMYL